MTSNEPEVRNQSFESAGDPGRPVSCPCPVQCPNCFLPRAYSVRLGHMFDPARTPNPQQVYRTYLRTCEMLGFEPVPRARVTLGPGNEVWTGRPEPMEH